MVCAVVLPIYVISLRTSTSRRRAMTQRMAALGLDFEFMDAVRGGDILVRRFPTGHLVV